MRILLIQPNYHSGGAEIAGNWPSSWVPYVGGALKTAGFTDIEFIDAMTYYIEDDELGKIILDRQPDVVLATAITPMIYKAEAVRITYKKGKYQDSTLAHLIPEII